MNCILNEFRPNLRLIALLSAKRLFSQRFLTTRCVQYRQTGRSLTTLTGHRWSQSSLLSTTSGTTDISDANQYERIADHTLEHLCEELEKIVDSIGGRKDVDVSLNNGVITLNLAEEGVYVINKQTPNRQIWLSSPLRSYSFNVRLFKRLLLLFSGPKRYDYLNNQWLYKRDGISLFQMLSSELSDIFRCDVKIKDLDPI